jgi:hypothetical protein
VVHLQKVNKVAILDWGHGGLNPEGEYYTAPNKQFDHGDQHTFHDGGMFYEGVWNQAFTLGVARELDELGLPYILINREDYDMPLAQRVDIANWWGRKLKGNCFGFLYPCQCQPWPQRSRLSGTHHRRTHTGRSPRHPVVEQCKRATRKARIDPYAKI